MDIKNFFNENNTIEHIPEEEYDKISQYYKLLDSVTRTTYKSLYIIDYFKKSFLYVSDNPLFLCGLKADDVKQLGYDFYFKHVPKEEIEVLKEINNAGFNFFDKIPIAERLEYTISYEFNIVPKGGRLQLINHQLTPICLNSDGKIWLALCMASISRHDKVGSVEIYKNHCSDYWKYEFSTKRWEVVNGSNISEIERDILRFSLRGYTMSDIARELYRSEDAIKSAKKVLFGKLCVNNITEAVYCAISRRLI